MIYRIKAISDLSGVSIRTLHHYDAIGLLKPHSVTEAGYREYSQDELQKLRQILFFRELDFSLSDIKRILDDPEFDQIEALKMHRRLLVEKRKRLGSLIRSIDTTVSSRESNSFSRSNQVMFEGLSESTIDEYREEARQKWGGSIAWAQSEERTNSHTKKDWDSIKTTTDEINQTIVSGMSRGANDSEVQTAVANWHALIDQRFYSCSLETFAGLGEMYVDDERFRSHYEQIASGLDEFMRDAIRVYVKPE
jgi:DNA-binding transcriptional MerR regulator